jgi:hypothetical protein
LDKGLNSPKNIQLLIAWEISQDRKIIGVLYFFKEKVDHHAIFFIPCLAVDLEYEKQGIASKLIFVSLIKELKLHPFENLYLALRTAHPRVAGLIVKYSDFYFDYIQPKPEKERQFCHKLANIYYPHENYNPTLNLFENCYPFEKDSKDQNEIDYHPLETHDSIINSYFKQFVYRTEGDKVYRKGNAMWLIGKINITHVLLFKFKIAIHKKQKMNQFTTVERSGIQIKN